MSHHFDYTADERLDISDAYCFAGPSDALGPRTVFGMNASPNDAGPWTEDAFDNATKVILNQDFVSGLTQPAKLLDYFPYLAPPPES